MNAGKAQPQSADACRTITRGNRTSSFQDELEEKKLVRLRNQTCYDRPLLLGRTPNQNETNQLLVIEGPCYWYSPPHYAHRPGNAMPPTLPLGRPCVCCRMAGCIVASIVHREEWEMSEMSQARRHPQSRNAAFSSISTVSIQAAGAESCRVLQGLCQGIFPTFGGS
jgi:hypothetical protein